MGGEWRVVSGKSSQQILNYLFRSLAVTCLGLLLNKIEEGRLDKALVCNIVITLYPPLPLPVSAVLGYEYGELTPWN